MTTRKRAEEMDRARAKRQRKKGKQESTPEPPGVIGQMTQIATDAARSVGKAVKSAADAITGSS
jgi:hypothetical protein